MGNAGLSIFSPKNFPANFLGIGPHKGTKALCQIKTPSTFPIKPSETPIFRTSPSKGYNPSTEPQNALKIAPFQLSAPFGHLPTCTQLRPSLVPDLHPDLHPSCPKYPVFQHFLAHKKCFFGIFRDQLCVFARLSCIEKGFGKNMARILRGLKGILALLRGGGWVSRGVLPLVCPWFALCGPAFHLLPFLPWGLPCNFQTFPK